MILLHRLNGEEFILNLNHIEIIEGRPDTTITLSNDKKMIVSESVDEVRGKIIEYQRMLFVHE